MGKITFAYWDIRGRAGPARLILECAGAEYEDVRYDVIPTDKTTRKWSEEKNSIGLTFPNLPYLLDGDVKLTESWAIYRYLGRKFNLFPTTEAEIQDCDMVEGVLHDLTFSIASLAYDKDMVSKLDEVKVKQVQKIKEVDAFLSEKDYVCGSKITFVDCALFEIFDWHRMLFPDIFDDMSNVQKFMKTFESLEKIANYLKSDRFKKFPILAPFATWGGKCHDDRTW